jgi:hypothetical protein
MIISTTTTTITITIIIIIIIIIVIINCAYCIYGSGMILSVNSDYFNKFISVAEKSFF